jgi:hypothetical protein
VKVFLRLSFVGVRKLIFRPLQSVGYLNSARINLNWARANLGEKEKQLSSQYDSDHLRASQYFGRDIIFWKDIIFVQVEVGLKISIARDQRCYVSRFLCFLKVSRQIFTMDTFG